MSDPNDKSRSWFAREELIWRAPLDGSLKLLLLCLHSYYGADSDAEAWPSQSTIAKRTGFADRSVRRCAQKLSDMGIISMSEQGRRAGGLYENIRYVINWHRLESMADQPNQKAARKPKQRADKLTVGQIDRRTNCPVTGGQNVRLRADKLSAELSSINYPYELSNGVAAAQQGTAAAKSTIDDEFMATWNGQKGRYVAIKTMTTKRSKALKARLRDPFFRANWKAAIERMAIAKWLQQGDFWPNVEWFLRPDSVTKIMEGCYDANFRGNATLSGASAAESDLLHDPQRPCEPI